MTRERLSGWGRTTPTIAEVQSPTSEDAVAQELSLATGVIARGLGRSYGDAAQISGGVVINNRSLGGIGTIAPDGVVSVGAGVSIEELLNVTIPLGWFVPVTPGTRQVTIGGAIAADVHGKNHHRDGSLGDHVLEMRLVTPQGSFTVSPTLEPELFWATIGGMGLTGIVTTVTLRLHRIETDKVLVDTTRFKNLDDVMASMVAGDDDYRYSVAWVDCMTKGASMGRAILTRGEHATRRDLEQTSLVAPGSAHLRVPFNAPSGLLNPLSIRVFNELWFRSAPQRREGEDQSLGAFFHPLDGLNDWNRLYGRRGFVQYQFAVSRRPSRGRRARHRTPLVLGRAEFPRGAQALRPSQSRPLVLPHLGLDAGPGPAGRAQRSPGRARRPRRDGDRSRRTGLPRQGLATQPRAPCG